MMGVTGASMTDQLAWAAEMGRQLREAAEDWRRWQAPDPPDGADYLSDEEWAAEEARERQAEDAAADARLLGDDREWNRLNP